MAEQTLSGAGFGARYEANTILNVKDAAPNQATRLVCITVLEQGSSTSAIRYLLRRVARQMPQASVAVCLWHASGDSAVLGELRSQAGLELIVFSLGELVALARAVCARRERLAA
jgi:hypothetical protein